MKYKQTFSEAYQSIYESAAAREIDRTNTRRDSMDYQMYKKSAELLRKKDYVALGNHIYNADTAPREYVMNVISKKEPATFKKMYGNQTGYMSLMKPKGLKESFALYALRDFMHKGFRIKKKGDRVGPPMDYTTAVKLAKQHNVGSSVGGRKRVEIRPFKEDKDHEVSMAVGQVRVMKERLDTIMSFLSSKTDDYNIEGWVQSYITSAEETLTTIADYLDKNPEVQSESRASTGASHNINQDDVKDSDTEKEKELKIKLDKEKDTDALERQIINLTGQLSVMKQKLENEKNRVVKPEPNPDTGEVPLRTGLANAIMSKKGKSDDLVKKVEKPKEMKISGQSKIQVNPKADLGQYAGGNKVNTGNLH